MVEDYAPFRRIVCAALQQRPNFQIIQAADGLEAVQKARELQPDLILLDINLPKLNGIEAAKRIRTLVPRTKFLFVSTEASSDVIRETFRVGAQGYVQKLRALRDLVPAVDAVLGGQRFVSPGLAFNDSTDLRPVHRHDVLFCSDDGVLLDGFARFIAAALNVGHVAIALVTESHRDGLLRSLRTRGVDSAAATAEGRYILLDVTDTLSNVMVEDWPDPLRFSNVAGDLIESATRTATGKARRLAACGECAPTLWAEDKVEAAIQLERLWDGMARSHHLEILCGYPLLHRDEDDQAFTRLCGLHTAVAFR